MADTTGELDLRKEYVESVVTGFALQAYVMKEIVMVTPSSSWQESYYQESSTELSGGTGSAIKGVPRLANFPYGEASWTKQSSYITKYGFEGVISYEDRISNNIDVVARTLLRIARAVVKAVDDEIWDVLSESQSPSAINSVTIAAGDEWDSATVANRDPVQDILNAIKEIAVDNYPIYNGNGYLLLSPKDYANILGNANLRNVGEFYKGIVQNGNVGVLLGLKVKVSNSITASGAMVVLAKECATWKQAAPLKTVTIDNPGISTTIRSFEMGTTQLKNPEAVCFISNTQA